MNITVEVNEQEVQSIINLILRFHKSLIKNGISKDKNVEFFKKFSDKKIIGVVITSIKIDDSLI